MVGAGGIPLYVRPPFAPFGPSWGRLGYCSGALCGVVGLWAGLPSLASWGRPGAVLMRPRLACPVRVSVNQRRPRLEPPCGAGPWLVLRSLASLFAWAVSARLLGVPSVPVTEGGRYPEGRNRCPLGWLGHRPAVGPCGPCAGGLGRTSRPSPPHGIAWAVSGFGIGWALLGALAMRRGYGICQGAGRHAPALPAPGKRPAGAHAPRTGACFGARIP